MPTPIRLAPPRIAAPVFPSRRRRGGFTLVELLTVIAIIGVLAGIVITSMGRAREAARTAQCSSGLRQIAMAMFLYTGDNKGFLPAGTIPKEVSGLAGDQQWSKQIRSYLPQRGTTLTAQEHPLFVCPSAEYSKPISEVSRTYFASAAIFGPNANGTLGQDVKAPRKVETLTERPRTPMILEGKESGSSGASQSVYNWTTISADIAKTSPKDTVYLDFRHGERMNVAFADGSVRSQTLAEMTAAYDKLLWEGRR